MNSSLYTYTWSPKSRNHILIILMKIENTVFACKGSFPSIYCYGIHPFEAL